MFLVTNENMGLCLYMIVPMYMVAQNIHGPRFTTPEIYMLGKMNKPHGQMSISCGNIFFVNVTFAFAFYPKAESKVNW